MISFKALVATRLELGRACGAQYDDIICGCMTDIAEEMDRRFPIAENEEAGSRSPMGRTIDGRPVVSACGVEQATTPELAKALKAYDEAVLSGREREADLMHDVRRLRSKLAEATAQRDALLDAIVPIASGLADDGSIKTGAGGEFFLCWEKQAKALKAAIGMAMR